MVSMKLLKWIMVVTVLTVVGIGLRLTVFAPGLVEVRVTRVTRGTVEETVTNTRAGTVKVRRRAKLSPQLGGLVVAIPHREGESVATGDLLLQLDDRAQQANLELTLRSVASATARADEVCLVEQLADKDLARVLALHNRGIASEQNLDLLRTERDRAHAACLAGQAAIAQAEAQVTLARVQIVFTELRAPFEGIVAELSTEVGEWITPSPPGLPIPPVVDLLDPSSVYISAPIDEIDAERISVGQPVRLTVDSRPDQSYAGTVERIAPYVLDLLEQNRTVEVEVAFNDTASIVGVLPGTSADIEVILSSRTDVLRVPSSAVAADGGALVLNAELLEERKIEIGLRNWQYSEAVSGVQEGELVVVSRNSTAIKAGARARSKDGA